VVSSGRGGLLPPGLDIGVVSSLGDDKARVATAVDWDRLESIRLLDYARVVPPEVLAIEQRELYGPPPPPGLESAPPLSAGANVGGPAP
jgi:cell shape-determining protein MreC